MSMSPEAASSPLTQPIRTCVGCRTKNGQTHMLRYGLVEGTVVPARGARPPIPGRSAYLCSQRSCLDRALKRRAFARAFSTRGRQVSVRAVEPNALWSATLDSIQREIRLLDRSAENSQAHQERTGLKQLLLALTSHPAPTDSMSARPGGSING